MGELKAEAKAPGKVQKSAPWVAIATAAIIPFFTYLQASSEARAAAAKAQAVGVRAEETGRQATAEVGKVQEGQGAVYHLLVRELERLAGDVEACHERVDQVDDELDDLASTPRERRARHERVAEQRTIERPPAAMSLPKAKGDVKAGDPLRGVLE
jgi:hypothetical protein